MTETEPREFRTTFTYKNWRGETARRVVDPIGLRFGASEFHPEPQWLLRAFDVEKEAIREFAMRDMTDVGSPEMCIVIDGRTTLVTDDADKAGRELYAKAREIDPAAFAGRDERGAIFYDMAARRLNALGQAADILIADIAAKP